MAKGGNEMYRPVVESCSSGDENDTVTPFIARSKSRRGFKYEKMITNKIDNKLRRRIEMVRIKNGGPDNHFLDRDIFFSHRDMEKILDSYEKGESFYLYTGRGPSSEAMHIGHIIPFVFSRWLQEVFDVPLVIQMSDDEKYFSEDLQNCEERVSIETIRKYTRENVKDIIALGFDVNKTFIFSNFEYMCPEYYKNICRIQKRTRASKMKSVFDFNDDGNIGKINFPAIQAAPCFSSSFPHIFHGKRDVPCLVPCAIDQDCYFVLTREVATKMDCKMPALIHSKFVPSLVGGLQFKMSASKPESSIFLTDTDEAIEGKIRAYNQNFESEGSAVDVIWHYLCYFMKDDDEFDRLKKKHDEGKSESVELKEKLIETLKTIIGEIRQRREQVTDEMVKSFMTPRPLNYKYNHGSKKIF